MEKTISEYFTMLIHSISHISEVQSIGKSGGKVFPESNESDIDVFVFCDEIPSFESRQAQVNVLGNAISNSKISIYEGKYWGVCDFVYIHDTEICLMYFTIAKMEAEIISILRGERLEKEDGYFYPTGRCATIVSLYILQDKNNFIATMKEKLTTYPNELSKKLIEQHTRRLKDVEDLERAVSRNEVLFYHFALDISIDHFLQALYAINKCYFPSRKRTLDYIKGFTIKPANCAERLLRVIESGGKPDTIMQSYDMWISLCKDLFQITNPSV